MCWVFFYCKINGIHCLIKTIYLNSSSALTSLIVLLFFSNSKKLTNMLFKTGNAVFERASNMQEFASSLVMGLQRSLRRKLGINMQVFRVTIFLCWITMLFWKVNDYKYFIRAYLAMNCVLGVQEESFQSLREVP